MPVSEYNTERNIERSGIVITFFSTASAVGKTLLSINMASELAMEGFNVCLVDYDLQFGDVANYLQLGPAYTIADVCKFRKSTPGQSWRSLLTTYRHTNASFSILPSPLQLSEAYNMDSDELKRVVEDLRKHFDYVVVDTTSMFSSLNLALLDISTIITFLGIVDFIPTVKNMKIGMDTLKSLGYETNRIRLILNRSDARSNLTQKDVEDLLGESFYHILPNDFRAASSSISSGIPLVLNNNESRLSTEMKKLVARYTNRVYRPESIQDRLAADRELDGDEKQGGWFSKFF